MPPGTTRSIRKRRRPRSTATISRRCARSGRAIRATCATAMSPDLLASYWTICGAAEPHTDREYSPFSLQDRAASASRAGFTGLGIWHADLAHLRSKHSLREMKRILDDHGIKHLELEFLTDWFVDGEKRKASDVTRRMLLESAAGLGARHIKVGDFFKTPVAMGKLIEEFAKLCS